MSGAEGITVTLTPKQARLVAHALETQIMLWQRQAAWDDDATILNDAALLQIALDEIVGRHDAYIRKVSQ